MNRSIGLLSFCALSVALAAGCGDDTIPTGDAGATYPSFSTLGKADGDSQIDFIQDIGTNTVVQGRFMQDLRYRGFTFYAEAGQTLDVGLQALEEVGGYLTEEIVDAQLLLYGPVQRPGEVYSQVIQDTGLTPTPELSFTVERSGYYMIAATRLIEIRYVQFVLWVGCANCGEPDEEPERDLLCEPGKLMIEGNIARNLDWNRCEVILLEPLRVEADDTLTIGPDVTVRAHYYITDYHSQGWGETVLTLDGKLVMESSPGHPIVFESNLDERQWVGVRINSEGNRLHDFVLRDTHEGLTINASGNVIHGAELELNRRGIYLTERANETEIRDCVFHDNAVGITNGERSRNEWLIVSDSELYLNDKAIVLHYVDFAIFDRLTVTDNVTGLQFVDQARTDQDEEESIIVSDSRIEDNARGIWLSGNGVIDGNVVRNNDEYGVRVETGWQLIKNNRIEGNGSACDPTNWQANEFVACGAIHANAAAHAVIRNNLIERNHGYGIVLQGQTQHPSRNRPRGGGGYDPAVLNSELRQNKLGAIFFANGPLFSVEYNVLEDNGPAELTFGFGWQACWSPANTSLPHECALGNNRLQRNTILTGERFFDIRIADERQVDREQVLVRNTLRDDALEASRNYFAGLSEDALRDKLPWIQGVNLAPVLRRPESAAGLIVPLERD